MKNKILLVGLGNPGKEFANTRHNVGFLFLERLKKEKNFPCFKVSNKTIGEISKKSLNDKIIYLLKPLTFMNNSGESVKRFKNLYNIELQNIFVIHDEIDLPLGKFKIQKGRGSAGHKGVENIIQKLKSKNFWRIRIGISPQKKPNKIEKFVLGKFKKKEKKNLKEVFTHLISLLSNQLNL